MAKLKFDFNPFKLSGIQLRGAKRKEALEDLKDLLLDRVLVDMGKGISSVNGKRWQGLSKDYKAFKTGKKLGPGRANLELTGDMKEAIEIREKGTGLTMEIIGNDAKKADLHNHFFKFAKKTSKAELKRFPKRQFMPNEKSRKDKKKPFRTGIMKDMARIIKDLKETD